LDKGKGKKPRAAKPDGIGLYSEKTLLVHAIIQSWVLTLVPRSTQVQTLVPRSAQVQTPLKALKILPRILTNPLNEKLNIF
jgi:hypothetical protein